MHDYILLQQTRQASDEIRLGDIIYGYSRISSTVHQRVSALELMDYVHSQLKILSGHDRENSLA